MKHLSNLLVHIPDLKQRRILDLGSGKGSFLIDLKKQGFLGEGIEVSKKYIAATHERAKEEGVVVHVVEGVGEQLPFEDSGFDFINAAEVIEHVQNPNDVLKEMSRVLSSNGCAYISVPNRFGFFDPHYHMYFINWLPRNFSEPFLSFFGKQKDYSKTHAGLQKLSEMHYMTRKAFELLVGKYDFVFVDSREKKVKQRLPKIFKNIGAFFYRIYAFFFVSTYHGILYKNQ